MDKVGSVTGVMKTHEIRERQSYYDIRKALEDGSVVRLKNGVYASVEALADSMIDIERVVPGGVLCLYSAWAHFGLTTQIPGAFYVAVEKHRKVVVPQFPPIALCYWEQKYYDMGVVEDMVSTGKSSLEAVDALRAAGAEVVGMVALFTYGFDLAAVRFAEKGVTLSTLSCYQAILEAGLSAGTLRTSDLETLREWRRSPSTWGQ